MKLCEGSVFICVCLSIGGVHVTIAHDALDLTVQGPIFVPPKRHGTFGPLPVTSGGQRQSPLKRVQLRTLSICSWHLVIIEVATKIGALDTDPTGMISRLPDFNVSIFCFWSCITFFDLYSLVFDLLLVVFFFSRMTKHWVRTSARIWELMAGSMRSVARVMTLALSWNGKIVLRWK